MNWGLSVSERYGIRCKKINLKALEDRFKTLEQDYEDVSKQRNSEKNAQEVNNFERQLKTILENLSKIESEINGLKKEIQEFEATELNTNIPEALQTLVNLLTGIDFEIVAKIYRSCLSQGRRRLVPDTLETLVQQLADIPGEPNEPEPLLQFVSLLVQEPSLTAEQQESLRVWAIKQGMTILKGKPESSETAEVCLMVTVKPRALNDPSFGYVVSAAISHDPDPWKPDVKPITVSLEISVTPDPKFTPGYSEEDLPLILDALIVMCGKEYPLSDLVIQWFLPIELMNLPLEHWQIQISKTQKQCNGVRCKAVIVRSYDRHFLPEYQSASKDWQKYWTRLSTMQESKCSDALVRLDPITGKTQINWKSSKVVGCRFVEHHDPQQQSDLWEQLLGQGLPIALWTRQSGTKSRIQSVTKCSIVKLSEMLAEHRQRALSHDSETDRLKAASHCLLLDNPFRPFPTLDYQST